MDGSTGGRGAKVDRRLDQTRSAFGIVSVRAETQILPEHFAISRKHCTAENALRLATLEVRIAEAVAKPAEAELQRCGMANAYSGAYVCKLLSAAIREACRPVY